MPKKVLFSNSLGQRLVGVLNIPGGQGLFPAVILVHGFARNHDDLLIKDLAKKFNSQGIATLRFSLSGTKPSQGSYRQINPTQYVNDIWRAREYLRKFSAISQNRIGLAGFSLGAFSSLMAAGLHPGQFRSLVSLASLYNLRAVVRTYQKEGRLKKVNKDYWQIGRVKVAGNFLADPLFSKKNAVIKKIHSPVLIVHGSRDKRVSLRDARAIDRLLGEPKELKIIKGADHHFSATSVRKSVVSAAGNWFASYLKKRRNPVIVCYLKYQNKVLLLKRSGEVGNYKHAWSGIGGYFQPGENTARAALREIKEELGLNFKRSNLKKGKVYSFDDQSIDASFKVNPFLIECSKLPKIRLDWEHESSRWLSVRQALNLTDVIGHFRQDFKALNLI